ncbi:MAG: triose-phosphate isomerase [Candidatus Woesearchaeota archaeon]|jgi:triosephosphate isomerase|nr:triose-phosphate isomerase [Candidatus Woesearchaeota archaeon]
MNYKLIINLKTYEESFSNNAIKIAKICKGIEKEAKKRDVEIILCPNFIDLKDTVKEKVSVYSQHIDDVSFGAHTGYILPVMIKKTGAMGTLISHSEHILSLKEIEKRINIAKELGLETCVCARDAKIAKKIAKFNPDYIAVEPKELIGGDISISTAKPELIVKSMKAVGNVGLLVGAGVKNQADVRKSVELGAKGILVASGVVKAKNIKAAVLDLIKGFE